MHKFKALVVLNLKAMLSAVRFGGRRKSKLRAVSGVGAMALVAFLGLYLSGVYSFLFASQFAPLGMVHLVLLMMPVLAVVMGLIFTVFGAQGIIFGGKDNDIMLALPIPAFQLMLARTLALYLENLVFSLFVMIPAGVAYLVFGGGGGALFFVVLLLCTLFLALIPTVLAILMGYLLAWFSGRFGRKALLSNLLYCGAFVLLMVFIFQLNFSIQTLTSAAIAGIEGGFNSIWGAPFVLMMEAACQGNVLSLLLFLAICVIPFLAVVRIFAGSYKKIVTSLGAKSARNDYKLGTLTATSVGRALLLKESKRFFGTPSYFFNTGIGLIFLLIGGAAALFFQREIQEFLALLRTEIGEIPVMPILCVGVAFLLSMTAITASSISLEGKQLWILKEAPIGCGRIFAVKAGFQLLVEVPCIVISSVCLGIALRLAAAEVVLLLVVSVLFAFFSALLGLYANLSLPKLDALNDAMVVKNSASALVATFVPMVLCGVLSFLWYFIQPIVGGLPATLLCAIVLAAGGLILLQCLNTKGKVLWQEL